MQNHIKINPSTLALFLSLFPLASPTFAATNCQEIIVYASRANSSVQKIPANVSVVTETDIERTHPASVPESLQTTPGIKIISNTGNPAQGEITMRGFGEGANAHTAILLDGYEINRPDLTPISWLQIPIDTVERIEVLRGAQSVLYGNHAVAGVINVISKKPTTGTETHLDLQLGSYLFNAETLTLRGAVSNSYYLASLSHQGSDGYRHNSDYHQEDAHGSLAYDFSDALQLQIRGAYDQLAYGLPGGLTREQMQESPRQTLTPNDKGRDRQADVQGDLIWQGTDTARLTLKTLYRFEAVRSDIVSFESFSDNNIATYQFAPRLVLENELGPRQNKILLGSDLYFYDLYFRRYETEARDHWLAQAEIGQYLGGVYLQDELNITRTLVCGLGGRGDYTHYAVNVDTANTNDTGQTYREAVFEASLLYKPLAETKFFTRAAQVYRYPAVDELVSYAGYSPSQIYHNLQPEEGQNYEVGTELAVVSNLTLNVTFFCLNMQNEITFNPATFQNENMDDSRRLGTESSIKYTCLADTCQLYATHTYTDARFRSGPYAGNRLPLTAEHEGGLGGCLHITRHLESYIDWQYVGPQPLGSDWANSESKLDQYFLTNIGFRYRFSPNRTWHFFAGINNLFDENYASLAYKGFGSDAYYPSPGRNYKIGLAGNF